MTAPRIALLTLVLLLLVPVTARGQEHSRWTGSLALLNTQPLGELSTGPGLGVALAGSYALDPSRIFRIHGEFRASIYDHERREICFSSTVGCRILLDLDTNYSIVYAGIGPQIVIPVGPTDLALDGTIGWAAFTAASSLHGVDEHDESFGETTNYEDNTLAWSTGGELRIPLGARVALGLGAHYQHNGVVSYLREGGIIDNPDGTISFDPQRTEANLVAITLGVTVTPFVRESRWGR
ncbi:MAG TPA: hypothetical protein VMM12_09145 [Longimicrobiales bacterium]|nr:hypothetical protein [Longimicrobiales bacterium]